MSNDFDDASQDTAGFVRVSQIIAFSLASGVSVFLAVALSLRYSKGLFAPNPWDVMPPRNIVSFMALMMAAIVTVLSFAIPRQIAGNMRRVVASGKSAHGLGEFRGETSELLGVYQTQMIIGLALLEGGAFFNGVAYLIEGHAPNLIAAVVLLLLILARFPTEQKIEDWAEVQRQALLEERNLP